MTTGREMVGYRGPMRVLIVTDQFPPTCFGGMAQHAYHIARYLGERHEVLVLIPRRQETRNEGELFAVRRFFTMRFPRYDALRLKRLARSYCADVIHSCTASLAFFTLSKDFPMVTRVVGNDFLRPWCGHNLPFRSILNRLPGKSTRLTVSRLELRLRRNKAIKNLRHSHVVVANSDWTRDRLIENNIPRRRIETIVGGVDTNTFQPCSDKRSVRVELGLPAKGLVLLTAAILVRKKGIDTVIRAVAQLVPKWPSLRYVVVGKGEDEEHLKYLVDRLGMDQHVIFVKEQNQVDLSKYYQASDVYVQISRNYVMQHGYADVETMGRTYIEAGACGVPVIGARVGGVPSVVQDGKNGFLVKEPDDKVSIVNAIDRLLTDEKARDRMGTEGLRMAREKFCWDAVGSAFERVLFSTASRSKKEHRVELR